MRESRSTRIYLLVEQLLEIIFTFFTLKVVPPDVEEEAPAPELAEEADESEPLPGVPVIRTW